MESGSLIERGGAGSHATSRVFTEASKVKWAKKWPT